MPQSYDLKGNLAGDGTYSFTYDAENRLLTASKTGLAATYQYDPLGRRTRKSGTGVIDTIYLSDGTDGIAEYDRVSTNLTYRYIPGPGIDQTIAMVDANGAKSFFHTNKQGSLVAATDATNTRTEGPYTYDPYGNCFKAAQPCSALTSTIPYKYTGRRLDPETGFYYYRARYYDPDTGRFLQTDNVGYLAGMNLYSYGANDPLNISDPVGTCPPILHGCGGDVGDISSGVDVTSSGIGSTANMQFRPDIGSLAGDSTTATAAGLGGRTYPIPDVSNHPDVDATSDQIAKVVDRFGTAPRQSAIEHSPDFLNGSWTEWLPGGEDQSPFHPGASIEFHLHTRSSLSENLTNARFLPGPGDHMIPANYGAVMFFATPDRNSIIEVGIKGGSFFAKPIWQRENTTNPFQSRYPNWQPSGRDLNE